MKQPTTDQRRNYHQKHWKFSRQHRRDQERLVKKAMQRLGRHRWHTRLRAKAVRRLHATRKRQIT